jgi:soluble lytic murein transglycosylase-like protein
MKYFGIAAGASALTAALGAVAWPAVFAAAGLTAAYLFLKSDSAKNFFDKTSGAITGTGTTTVGGLGVLPTGSDKRGVIEGALSNIMPYLPESELLGNIGLKEGIKASNDIYDLQRTIKLRKDLLDKISKNQKDSDRVMDGSSYSGMGVTSSLGVPLWMKKMQIDTMQNIALPLQQEKYRRELEKFSGKRESSDLTNEESIRNAVFVAKEYKKNLESVLTRLKEQTEKEDELFKKSGLPDWAFAQKNPGFEEARLEREKMENEIKYIDGMIQGLEDPKKSLQSLNDIIESLNKQLEKFEDKFKMGNVVPALPNLSTKDYVTPIPQVSSGELSNVDGIISEASRQYNVPETLIKGMIRQESRGNTKAVSPKGAGGLMQLMPGTAKDLGVTNRFDPYQNIMGGTKYMKQMLDMYGGNVPLALAAYNAGPYNKTIQRGVIPQNGETPEYVRRVMAFEQQFRAIPNNKLNTFNTKATEQARSSASNQTVVVNNVNQSNVSGSTQAPQQSGNGGVSQPDGRGTSVMAASQ